MKNRLVPSWRAVSHTLAKEVNRALTNLHFLSPASQATLTAHILNEAQKVFVRVPFVNRPFESEIHGTVNFTQISCVLLVTWCYRVLLSCYLRPK